MPKAATSYSIGTKIECRILPSTCCDKWPLPVVSSTKITSPTPMTRLSPSLAVIFTPAFEIDDVLSARSGMPVDIVLGLGLAEDYAGGRQAFGELAASALLDPLHFDVAEM